MTTLKKSNNKSFNYFSNLHLLLLRISLKKDQNSCLAGKNVITIELSEMVIIIANCNVMVDDLNEINSGRTTEWGKMKVIL